MRSHLRSLAGLLAVALAVTLAPAAHATDLGLVQTLVGKLGITETQATGGAKALFGLAKDGLGADDFGKLTGAVPEVGDLLGLAGAATGTSGGGTTALVGAVAGVLGDSGTPSTGETETKPAAPAEGAASDGDAAKIELGNFEPKPATPPAETTPAAAGSEAKSGDTLATVASLAAAAGGSGALGSVGKLASLGKTFGDLGMDSGMVDKFVPVVLEYVGGKDAGALGILKKGLGL